VVLVFYWTTGCAVCRDKMRELRANLSGWNGQAFALLGVNLDDKRQDWQTYERLVAQTIAPAQRFASVWHGDADYRDSMGRPEQVPSACLINKAGQLIERYKGRIPAEAWDRISELL
jgi:peroxiredoxin